MVIFYQRIILYSIERGTFMGISVFSEKCNSNIVVDFAMAEPTCHAHEDWRWTDMGWNNWGTWADSYWSNWN